MTPPPPSSGGRSWSPSEAEGKMTPLIYRSSRIGGSPAPSFAAADRGTKGRTPKTKQIAPKIDKMKRSSDLDLMENFAEWPPLPSLPYPRDGGFREPPQGQGYIPGSQPHPMWRQEFARTVEVMLPVVRGTDAERRGREADRRVNSASFWRGERGRVQK